MLLATLIEIKVVEICNLLDLIYCAFCSTKERNIFFVSEDPPKKGWIVCGERWENNFEKERPYSSSFTAPNTLCPLFLFG